MKTKFQNDLQFKTARAVMITAKGEQGFMGIDAGDLAVAGIMFVVLCFLITPVLALFVTPLGLVAGKIRQKIWDNQAKFEEKLVDKAIAKEEAKKVAKLEAQLAALKAAQ